MLLTTALCRVEFVQEDTMRIGLHRNKHYVAARVWLVGLLFGLLSMVVVSAAIIDESATIPLTDTSYAQDILLNLFDPSLGHLQSVQVTVTGQLVGGWQYENTNLTKPSTKFTADFAMNQTLDITQGAHDYLSMATSTTTNGMAIPSIPKYDGTLDGAGTSGVTIPKINTTQTQVFVYNTAPTLAPFIGLGQVDFQVAANESDTITTHSKPGNFWLGAYSEGAATVNIQYTYTPTVAAVPEPGTTQLFGLGSLGLIAILWRRKKRTLPA